MSHMTFSTSTALGRELQTLTDERVLSPEQAAQLWQAAHQDQIQPAGSAEPTRRASRTATTGVLDVLGYVGGALLLGAVIFVGATLWNDLGRGQKIGLAIASFVAPLAGGLVLELSRTRRGLGRALLALACIAAGFVCYTIIEDDDLIITSALVLIVSAIGAFTVRSAAFYLPAWPAALIFVRAAVVNNINVSDTDALTYATAIGFVGIGLLLVLSGLVLGRHAAWTLAGLSGWAAATVLISAEHSILAALLAVVVAALLFAGVVRLQMYAFAVVGCLIVLSIWPWALYQILDSALGVAVGLVAAGCVLIASAVALARRRRALGR